ncbi:bifunctional 2-keto-4-hydroxyglutarate aldolase/2-keto-3-deoxy-6-phosphogluconate aldolase [Acholeplasma granularum]|uniref:bifunctional 2-keto-4-hydroxyglutarate aldolase/2-keto-3-deoxy-6-phosphogluconate aldolase n=1 Tax=Acholeplasma granularum TaxID=264635 RepID=UPI00046ED845|nr:bifunctional 2-keto-4-hydroxyglutarate aldolase/2-keto-3-deoxy-6-phosphogluconate aldolase [Acholeplasma granularum]
MSNQNVLQRIKEVGVVAVIRANTADEAIKVSKAVLAGGIPAIELTFTVPGAVSVLEELSKTFKPEELILGAGTVLDAVTARLAILAGATYIVSPGFDQATAEVCNLYGVPYMPGCLTITEMLNAQRAGAQIVKLFPGSAFGPSYVKAIRGPLPDIQIMPTGGVSLSNVKEWVNNGVVAVGVGGELTAPAKNGDYEGVKQNAIAFVNAVKEARK